MTSKPIIIVVFIVLFACVSFGQNSAVDHFNRGIDQRNEGEYEKAIVEFTTAIKLDPKMADAYYERGAALLTLDTDLETAMSDLSKAIELDKRYFNAHFDRGTIYQRKKDWDRAIADFTSYILIDPREENQSAIGYIERGKCLIEKNDLVGAIADFTKAVIAYPRDKAAYENRAIAYDMHGEKENAAADRKKAEQLGKP